MKKNSKNYQKTSSPLLGLFRDASVQAVMVLSLFAITAFLGILIAQRQSLLRQASSPVAPSSRPEAAGSNHICEMLIDIPENSPQPGVVSCKNKVFFDTEKTIGSTGDFAIVLSGSPQHIATNLDTSITDILPTELSFYQFVEPAGNVGSQSASGNGVSCTHSSGNITCTVSANSTAERVVVRYFVEETSNTTVTNKAVVTNNSVSSECTASVALAPTPSPNITCTNCNYQFDAYWGPVIKSFRENGKRYRYHSAGPNGTSRLLRSRSSRSISTGYPACNVGDPVSNGGSEPIVASYPCNGTNPSSYLSADIDTSRVHVSNGGYATATIRNSSSNCSVQVGFASYRANDNLSDPEIFDTQEYITDKSVILQAGETIQLTVPTAVIEENELQCIDGIPGSSASPSPSPSASPIPSSSVSPSPSASPNPLDNVAVCNPSPEQISASWGNPTNITNPYFPLPVGLQNTLEFQGESVRLTVTPETKVVAGVTTRVIEEYETADGVLVEISKNYFAQAPNGTVCYYGENVDIYDNTGTTVVAHDGTWLAGEGQNKAGIFMPASPAVGQHFRIEDAPTITIEEGTVTAIGDTIVTPYRTFTDTVKIREDYTGEVTLKEYARGIGLIGDNDMKLANSTTNGTPNAANNSSNTNFGGFGSALEFIKSFFGN